MQGVSADIRPAAGFCGVSGRSRGASSGLEKADSLHGDKLELLWGQVWVADVPFCADSGHGDEEIACFVAVYEEHGILRFGAGDDARGGERQFFEALQQRVCPFGFRCPELRHVEVF